MILSRNFILTTKKLVFCLGLVKDEPEIDDAMTLTGFVVRSNEDIGREMIGQEIDVCSPSVEKFPIKIRVCCRAYGEFLVKKSEYRMETETDKFRRCDAQPLGLA